MAYRVASRRKAPRQIVLKQGAFKKGYVSFYSASLTPVDAVIESLNMDLVMDWRFRQRPSLVRYGAPYLGECIGQTTFIKIVNGEPENWEVSMQVISGVGKICIRKDGAPWTIVGGNYYTGRWNDLCHGMGRVMISNKHDIMSYYDIEKNSLIQYTPLADPTTAPTVAVTGVTGAGNTYYLRYTAENSNGVTARSPAATFTTTKLRDNWAGGSTEFVTYTGTAITGAEYYNWYIGDSANEERWVARTPVPTFKDDATKLINPIHKAPLDNSTSGPILGKMWYSGTKFFGVDDKDNRYYLWYSGDGEYAGSWSPFLGAGYVAIDYGGSTVPVGGLAFHDGKGTSAITVLSKGSAGAGLMNHVAFNEQTLGDSTYIYPEVYRANGQAGAYGSRCIIEANNDIHYLTGLDFKKTGMQSNVVNILSTNSTSQAIEKDLPNLNLTALEGACVEEYNNALYWCLPVNSSTNNQIWKYDLGRNGVWVMPWTIPAKHIWKYEDNNGNTHLCVLVNNVCLEFSRSVLTQDDGVVFPTRLVMGGLVFDETGQSLADVESSTVKFLNPVGKIDVNATGLDEDLLPTGSLANTNFTQTVDVTGWNEAPYNILFWNTEYGVPQSFSKSVGYARLDIDETLNQLSVEITTNSPSDYILASHRVVAEVTDENLGD